MKRCVLVTSLLFFLLLASFLPAQQTPDSTNGRLATILHLAALTNDDWQFLRSEANSGNAEAQYWLGRIYDGDRLLSKDPEKSAGWYHKSAEQGYAPAEYVVCLMHADRDTLQSERCMRRAAEDGVPVAQFLLGIAYERNDFGTTDEQEALKWYRKAAEHGNPDAEVELGSRYRDGDGVEQNYVLAARWYRRAAEHVPDLGGAGQGRNELGLLYLEGLGVPKDYVQAYLWFSVADVDSNIAAAQEEMNPEQILKARKLAEDWKKQHPDPAIY